MTFDPDPERSLADPRARPSAADPLHRGSCCAGDGVGAAIVQLPADLEESIGTLNARYQGLSPAMKADLEASFESVLQGMLAGEPLPGAGR